MKVKMKMQQESVKSSAVKVKVNTTFINGEENPFAVFIDTAYVPMGIYEELGREPNEPVDLTLTDEEPDGRLLYQEMEESRETKNTRVLDHKNIYLDGEPLSNLAVGIRGVYLQKDAFDKAFSESENLWMIISFSV